MSEQTKEILAKSARPTWFYPNDTTHDASEIRGAYREIHRLCLTITELLEIIEAQTETLRESKDGCGLIEDTITETTARLKELGK